MKKRTFARSLAALLIVTLFISFSVSAASAETMQPYASRYLDSYNSYVYPAGGGKIQVYFSVTGTDYMDELGVLTIQIYECTTNSSYQNDWTWKATYKHNTTSGMLSYNDFYHSGHVDYQGVAGRYYKAYVCVWGGSDGTGDTRYFWTSAKQAT